METDSCEPAGVGQGVEGQLWETEHLGPVLALGSQEWGWEQGGEPGQSF